MKTQKQKKKGRKLVAVSVTVEAQKKLREMSEQTGKKMYAIVDELIFSREKE